MKSEIKSILNVVSANILVVCIGIAQSFMLPSILNPIEYGYWTLYLLYVGYTGFIILGFCDGFYLILGGKKYKDLDKRLFSSYHIILISYLLILFCLWVFGVEILLPNSRRAIVLFCVGVGGVLACLNSYFILLNQATARFSIYAKGSVIEKIVILIVAVACIFLTDTSSFYIIFAALVGRLITTVYFTYHSRDIVLSKPKFNPEVWSSVFENTQVGFILTLSNVGGMLMTGFGRFVVENRLGIEELGYYSLMFTVAALFTQLIYAVSTAFYPLFNRVSESRAKYLLGNFDQLIINLGMSILIIYYPVRYLLDAIFPKYHPAMDCILYLFPIVICQGRMTVVYNTLYKVFRMEKQIMKNVSIAFVFCAVVTIGMFNIYPQIETIALATYLSFLFWNAVTIWQYNKIGNTKTKMFASDVIVSGIYIAANYAFGYSLASFAVTFAIILLFMVLKGKQTISLVKEFKTIMFMRSSTGERKSSITY